MQTADAISRVAAECVEDLAADGVVYAEVRYAPELSTQRGLTLDEVVEAILDGFNRGAAHAAKTGRRIRIGLLLCAMRQQSRAKEIAELTVRYRDAGVVGFDIAGPEAGFPPTRFLDSFEYLRRENCHFTIHAGEGFGLPSIWEAIQWCGAARLGHGVRIVDDIEIAEDGTATLGRLASFVRDRRIPLEMCPCSNLHTGTVTSMASHPIALLRRLHFRVTVNTDNRLMSQTSMTNEFDRLAGQFGYDLDDLQWFTVNAMKSAFIGMVGDSGAHGGMPGVPLAVGDRDWKQVVCELRDVPFPPGGSSVVAVADPLTTQAARSPPVRGRTPTATDDRAR